MSIINCRHSDVSLYSDAFSVSCIFKSCQFIKFSKNNQVVRRRIIAEGFRVDGRQLNEVRPVYCEAGNLPMLHGSSLFSRGDTQVSQHFHFLLTLILVKNNIKLCCVQISFILGIYT